MVVGLDRPRMAENTRLKDALQIGLDEALTALEEALQGLRDEQVAVFPISGRNNIAWIACHCLDNLDVYACAFQTGRRVLTDDPRWELCASGLGARPQVGGAFPSVRALSDLLCQVRALAESVLEASDEPDLTSLVTWKGRQRMRSDSLMRTICHTNAHVRQMWLLRGALGLADDQGWPRQHWA